MRINQGCKTINKKIFIPSHQKKRLSFVDIPMSTYHAIKNATDKATDKA